MLLCVIFGACKVEQQDPALSFKNIISVHRSAFDVPNDDSLYWHVRGPRCDQEVNVIEFYNSTFIQECKELLCSPMATADGAAASAPGAADLPRKKTQSPTRKLLVCIPPLPRTYPYIDACVRTCMHVHKHACIHTCTRIYIHTYIHTCIHTYMHACMHTYIHTYMHTCIHTYIWKASALVSDGQDGSTNNDPAQQTRRP